MPYRLPKQAHILVGPKMDGSSPVNVNPALRVIIGSYSAGESCATRRDGKIQERARPRRNLPASAPAGAKSNFRLRSLCPTSEEAGIPPPGGQVVLAGSSRPN